MGKTRDYLRFGPAGNFNIIASGESNVAFVTLDGCEGRFVAVAACENVIIWDMRTGAKAQVLNGEKSAVTAICASPNKKHLAVGYSDGLLNIFDLKTGDLLNQYKGHSSAVTCLAYSSGEGFYLASGSKDTDVVVWDILQENGLCRLTGHTGVITKLVFMTQKNVLITASKDTHVKFWDLDLKHCFKTLVGLGSEVWSIVLMNEDQYMVTATSDKILGIWRLDIKDVKEELDPKNADNLETHEDDDLMYPFQCSKVGTITRSGTGRVVVMCADMGGQIFACHGKNGIIEMFQFRSDEEAEAKLKKRVKRLKKKEKTDEEETKTELSEKDLQLSVLDLVNPLKKIKLSDRPKSLDVILGGGSEVRVAVCLSSNELELHSLNFSVPANEPKLLKNISYMQGHQSEVRAVAFSSDNFLMASGSGESVKFWNRPTQALVKTIETSSILSLVFAPGDKYVLAGTKEGKLLIIDIASSEILEEIPAHTAELWSVILTSDMRGVVTGGGDKTVKFWQFELITDKNNSDNRGRVLSVIHTRTLNLEDSVLCVRVSQNGKFLAVALLDTTVKIFFVDSFKLSVMLYGHKLPVLTMDISSDSEIIATGSADRNVKIWSMIHGDCQKNIFAHDDSISGLQFVPGTHMFFTCGKDGKIKQWDGDSFVKILTLNGHIGEAYGLAVSPNGKFIVSCGSDRVLRLYEKTEEILEIGDEAEMEREEQEPLATGKFTHVPGRGEVSLPSKKTVNSEQGASNILEALEVCEEFKLSEKTTLPPIMMAYQVETIEEYLIKVLTSIKTSDLEQALLLLPYDSVCKLMKYCPDLLEKYDDYFYLDVLMNTFGFLLKMHYSTIMQTHDLYETLEKFTKISFAKSKEYENLVGGNFYFYKYLGDKLKPKRGEKRKFSVMVMSS
ncbi:WD repeat-containing protein 3 [Harmonia axyridis]|uniref:WD repeat-containing protein 3 n=1 Tax=Harmonia axyridis TaxID=115357 RepID=UPI001E279497|nr:WD repeat-containing protein 3 [Harmonia axyridis]